MINELFVYLFINVFFVEEKREYCVTSVSAKNGLLHYIQLTFVCTFLYPLEI